MFKFLKELKDSIVEGYNEAKQELEEEVKQAQENKDCIENLSLENLAIAFSCPFREVLISGKERRLFYLNTLNEKDKNEAKNLLNGILKSLMKIVCSTLLMIGASSHPAMNI